MHVTWDERKRLETIRRRDYDFAALTDEFFVNAQILPARGGRFRATGFFGDAIISVIFKPLGIEAVSIVSMRRASRKERREYES